MNCCLAGRTDMSFTVMNGMPANISTSKSSTTKVRLPTRQIYEFQQQY